VIGSCTLSISTVDRRTDNLLVFTWSKPEIETLSVLAAMEDKAEEMLRRLLDVTDLREPDLRPLHVLVGRMLHETWLATGRTLVEAMADWGSELGEFMQRGELLERVRALDARSAATLPPLGSFEQVGSQQLVDRFPQHFETVAAMEQHRSRLKRSLASKEPQGAIHRPAAYSGDREQ
jgi:hypothetical protein